MSKPVFSFPAFLDFCKSKNPDEEFEYMNPRSCATAQYAHSIGMTWGEAKDRSHDFAIFDWIAAGLNSTNWAMGTKFENFEIKTRNPVTFGDLAKAIEEYMVDGSMPNKRPIVIEHV